MYNQILDKWRISILLSLILLFFVIFMPKGRLLSLLVMLGILILKYYQIGFILFIFALPLRTITFIEGIGFHFRLAYLFFGLTFLSYLIHKIRGDHISFVRTRIDLPLVCLLMIILFSVVQTRFIPPEATIVSDSFKNLPWIRGLTRFAQLFFFVAIFYFSVDFIKNLQILKKVIYTFMISTTFFSLYGLYGFMNSFFKFLPQLPTIPITAYSNELSRIRGFESEPMFFGLYLLTILPVFISLIFLKKEFINKKLLLPILLINLSALILTFSRSVWFGLLFALIIIFYNYRLQIYNNKNLLKSLFLVGLVLMLILIFLPSVFIKPILGAFDQNSGKFWSTKLRIITMVEGLKAFIQHPILGIGYDNFIFYYGNRYIEGMLSHPLPLPETNNLAIDILTELGILGFSIALWLAITILKSALRAIKISVNPILHSFSIGYLASFVGVAVSSLFFSSITFSYLWLMLGMIFAIINLSDNLKNKDIVKC